MKVTLISTVKDCADGVDAFLASLAAQTRAPDEVVIVDGGSTDGTAERFAADDTVTLIVEPGANIARGRNVALAAATHDVIAVTDADCILEPTWLAEIVAPIEAGADVSMGFYEAQVDGFLQACMASVNLPLDASEVDPATFNPSAQVGGLPSRRDRDGRRLPGMAGDRRGHVGRPAMARTRPSTCGSRPTPWCGGGPGHRSPRRGSSTSGTRAATRRPGCIRTATPCGSRPTADSCAALASKRTWPKLLAAAGGVAYARTPVRRAWRRFEGTRERAMATVAVPALIAFTDTAKMAGYAAGLADRARR